MPPDPDSPLIFILAGEPSGDILGGRLMAALKTKTGGRIRFAGIGGDHMEEQGLNSLFPMSDLSVMGLTEVLPHLPKLLRRLRETVDNVTRLDPTALVTIDSPDFCFRVARRLKGRGIPMIHYVAPSVWAWKPGRARKISGFLDHLLALLPFEPPYFERVGLGCTFVGHPVVESAADQGDGAKFRRQHNIGKDAPLICVLPGSRSGEATRLLSIFGSTLSLLKQRQPDLKAVVPTVRGVAAMVEAAVAGWPVPSLVVRNDTEKFDAFAASDVALAASGTVSLELAMANLPAVIAYRVSPMTAWLARRLLRVRHVSLVNIIMGREVVPERLQDDCRPEVLAIDIERLLGDPDARRSQTQAARDALKQLGLGGIPPSQRAAEAVLTVLAAHGRKV